MPIHLLILDVDGVLTDGGIIRDDAGQQIKRFHVRDGAGIVMWRRLGKKVAIITGKESQVVNHRAEELGIDYLHQNIANKLQTFLELLEETGLTPDQCAYVGDDLPDLAVMKRVAVPIAVADAVDEIRAVATYTTRFPGGYGAVRDAIEHLLKQENLWQQAVDRFNQ